MDTNSMFAFMDLLFLLCGLYILYAYYLLAAKNEIKEGVLIPKDLAPKKCKDFEGYKKYIGPKVLIFGIYATAMGGIGLYQDYVKPLPSMIYIPIYVLFFVVMILYLVATKKAEKMFW